MERSEAVSAALDNLLDHQTGDLEADCLAATREVWRRRKVNTKAGGLVIATLLESGWTLRPLSRATGIPVTTLRRWSIPPEEADSAPVEDEDLTSPDEEE